MNKLIVHCPREEGQEEEENGRRGYQGWAALKSEIPCIIILSVLYTFQGIC